MTLPFGLDPLSFLAGFATAVVIAAIVYGLGWFGRQIGAPMRPMTVVHTTARTPWQVTVGCASATLLLTSLGLVIAMGIAVFFFDAVASELMWMVVAAAAAVLLGLLMRAMA